MIINKLQYCIMSAVLLLVASATQFLAAQSSRLDSLPSVSDSDSPLVFQTAEVLFRFPAGGLVSYGPVGRLGLVWFMTDGRIMHVVSEDGRALGKRSLPARQLSFIVCDPFGRALVPEGNNQLSMINRAGQAVWTISTGVPDHAPVFFEDGNFLLALGSSLRLHAPNGQRLWQLALARPLRLAPQIDEDGNFLLVYDDSSWQIYERNGRASPLGGKMDAPVIAATPAGGGFFWLACSDNTVRLAQSAQSGAAVALGPAAVSAIHGQDGVLFVLDTEGRLSAFKNGSERLWQTLTEARGRAALRWFEDRLLITSGSLAASYDLNGRLLRQLRLANNSGQLWIGGNGSVFSGGRDWILYSYRFERGTAAGAKPGASASLEAAESALRSELFWISGGLANEESLLNRLLDIEKSVKSGTIGAGLEQARQFALALALGLADFSARTPGYSGRELDPGIHARLKACELLGLMGSPTVVPPLADLFSSAADPLLRSAAADAIARIGLDPDASAMRAFEAASRGRLDARAALSMISAVEALQRGGGMVDLQSGAAALVRLLGSDWPQVVRNRADQALRLIGALR